MCVCVCVYNEYSLATYWFSLHSRQWIIFRMSFLFVVENKYKPSGKTKW